MQILLADNHLDFLETRAEFLTDAGYHVLKASTLDEAQRILSEEYVHVAILDIHMVDDDDPQDISGLTLAKDPAFRHITKIIFTDTPTYEYAREAMKPTQDGFAPAVTFLAKIEGAGAMLKAIQEALKDYVCINLDLRIRWRPRYGVYSFAQLMGIIAPDIESGKLPERISELEDLFRKLFFTYEEVTISRILWEKEARVALGVFAYTHEREEQFLVVCGECQITAVGLENVTEYASYLGQTQVQITAETMHFAAIALSLNGVDLETLQSFATFYQENTGQPIRHCLDVLIQTTLSPWMQQTQQANPKAHIVKHFRDYWGLAEHAYPHSTFDHAIRTLAQHALLHKIVELTVAPEQLTFLFPGGQRAIYPNPAQLLYADESVPLPWKGICETAAGDLDIYTLLVEPSGQTWITDLHHTPLMPVGYNLAQLEISLRFSLISVDNFQTLWDFETQLLDATLHGQILRTGDVEPPYRKALTLIQDIRQTAKRLGNDNTAYQINLFLGALTWFVPYRPNWTYTRAEIARFLHTILFSAMLCGELDEVAQVDSCVAQSGHCPPLRVDAQNQGVWVGEHQIQVSSTEFSLLLYLYQHAGQLCKRDDIVREVFHLPNSNVNDRTSLISTNIERLRKKIESDARKPRYITTVWGQGYILVVQPK